MKSTPLDVLIEAENVARDRYSEMMEKASLSNIRYFLRSFLQVRSEFSLLLDDVKKGKYQSDVKNPENILDLHATEHLSPGHTPDLSSLSSTLLFISTQEKETFDLYNAVFGELEDGTVRDSLKTLMQQREQVKIKADRLYHDLVLSY